MLLDELKLKKHRINALASQYGAGRVRVFGSVARCEEQADSDVDFLVEFPVGYDMFKQRIPLTFDLSELLGRRVDLIPEHELNPHLRNQVTQEAIEL